MDENKIVINLLYFPIRISSNSFWYLTYYKKEIMASIINFKKILNFAYLNRLRRQFSLYRCSLPFHDGILICHDHEMCRVLEHEIKSEAIFTFTFGFVWYINISQFGFTMYHIWSILWSVFQYFVSYSFSIVEVNVSNIRKSQRYKRPVNYRLRKILSWNRANRWDSSYQYRELLTERLGF